MSQGGGPSAAASSSLLKKPGRCSRGGVSAQIARALAPAWTLGCGRTERALGTDPCPAVSERRVVFPVLTVVSVDPVVELCLCFALMGGAFTWWLFSFRPDGTC